MPRPWADQPYKLINTKPFSQDTSHAAYYVATEMALAHNGIIRGLNAIYLQAPNLPAGNETVARNFLIYCQCWSESIHHHHDAEESIFFPDIESSTKIKGIMEKNVEQHRAFTPGFDKFYEYCKTCPPKAYDGEKLRSIVEAFAEPLIKHLYDEIETLRALDKYDSEKIRQAYRRFEKSLMATDNVRNLFLSVNMRPLTSSSFESRLQSSVLQTGVSRVAFTTFQLYRSLCHMSSTTYFVCDTVEYGASIQVQAGGTAGN